MKLNPNVCATTGFRLTQPCFMSRQYKTWACRTMLGCFRGVSWEHLSGLEVKPHLFLSVAKLWICSRDAGPRFDGLPDDAAQQQSPAPHFVISGNKWTSPKSTGCSCIFLFLSGRWGGEKGHFYWKERQNWDQSWSDARVRVYSSGALMEPLPP